MTGSGIPPDIPKQVSDSDVLVIKEADSSSLNERDRIVKTAGILQTLLLLAVAAGATSQKADTVRIEVLRDGRKIMHDGFLMEWSLKTATVWGADSIWRFDAMATPEGLAGYMRLLKPQNCAERALQMYADSGKIRERIDLPPDTLHQSKFFKADLSMVAEDSTYTLEWLVPWPENYQPTKQPFSVLFEEWCKEERSLPVLNFVYRYRKKTSGSTGGLIGRVLIIGMLGALYLTVQAKIRRQSRKTESPHQSA